MTIDAHQHFWHYDPQRHAWIDDRMQALRRDFLPRDLAPILQRNGMDGCIAVQADQSEAETDFLLEQSRQYAFIKAVVGWIDLRSEAIRERLDHYQQYPKLKGFRHVVQDEPDPGFLLREDVRKGIEAVGEYGYTYDLLVFPKQLKAALQTVRALPQQQFVLDHIAKPAIAAGKLESWRTLIQELAALPNVYCKVSGLVTEARWADWQYEDFVPYLQVVTEAFGPDRLLFGSDWPVCLLAADYERMKAIVDRYTRDWSATERAGFFGGNASKAYRIR